MVIIKIKQPEMTERLDCFVTSLFAMTNVLCPSLRGVLNLIQEAIQ